MQTQPDLIFDSAGELASYIRNNRRQPGAMKASAKSQSDSWDGGLSFEHTVRALDEGYVWTEGMDKMKRAAAITSDMAAKADLPSMVRSVEGGAPCVPAAIMGNPKAMFKQAPQPSLAKPVLSIGVSATMAATITAKQRMNMAGALFSVIEELEFEGFRVELSTFWLHHIDNDLYSDSPEGWTKFELQVKGADQYFNASRMAFLLGHPAILRRAMFYLMESAPHSHNLTHRSYGTAICTKQWHEHAAEAYDLYIPTMNEHFGNAGCETAEQAFAWIQYLIKKQITDVEDEYY